MATTATGTAAGPIPASVATRDKPKTTTASAAPAHSDEELDADWVPNGRRPQSTLAQSFSQELMDIFRIENSVADLDEKVDHHKKQISTRTAELEALEAKIREMEKLLRNRDGQGDAANSSPSGGSGKSAMPPPDKNASHGALPPTPSASEGEYRR